MPDLRTLERDLRSQAMAEVSAATTHEDTIEVVAQYPSGQYTLLAPSFQTFHAEFLSNSYATVLTSNFRPQNGCGSTHS